MVERPIRGSRAKCLVATLIVRSNKPGTRRQGADKAVDFFFGFNTLELHENAGFATVSGRLKKFAFQTAYALKRPQQPCAASVQTQRAAQFAQFFG